MSKRIPEIQITSFEKWEGKSKQEAECSDHNEKEVWKLLSNLTSPGRTHSAVGSIPTDTEPMSSSDEDMMSSSFSQIQLSSVSNENTKIRERLINQTPMSPSPARTPEPFYRRSPVPTDTEYIHSDRESVCRRRRGKNLTDGFTSDLEDSDSSFSDNPFRKPRKNSLQDFGNSSRHERKISEPTLSDIKLCNNVDPFVQRTKQNKMKNSFSQKKKKDTSRFFRPEIQQWNIGSSNYNKKELIPFIADDKEGHTDIEEFDYDDKIIDYDSNMISFIPETKREIIIANENMKGDISLIIPIDKPSSIKRAIKMDAFDCGFSDVEDLPGYIEEELRPCPTPEPPLTEASYIKSSETIKEKSKLQVVIDNHEPLTDTEEINVKIKQKKTNTKESKGLTVVKDYKEPTTDTEEIFVHSGNQFQSTNSKNYNSRKGRKGQEPLTDSEEIFIAKDSKLTPGNEDIGNITDYEDLDVDEGNINHLSARNVHSDLIYTDVEEFSDDGMTTEVSARNYPEFEVISSSNMTTSKESHKPFSEEARSKLRSSRCEVFSLNNIPQSPSGPTEQEDMSGEDDISYIPGPELQLEPHASTVHIHNSRTFQPDNSELKVNIQPDPLTDIEELDFHEKRN